MSVRDLGRLVGGLCFAVILLPLPGMRADQRADRLKVTPQTAQPDLSESGTTSDGGFRSSAPVILNEYNAVGPGKYLNNTDPNGTDVFFGRIVENGGNWFELVVTLDHQDLRGWRIEWQEDPNNSNPANRKHGALTLTNHALWSNMRAGTIITFIEKDTAAGGLNTDTSFDPSLGDWWININTLSGGVAQTTYVTTTTDVVNDGPGNFSVGNNDWQLRILDASSTVVFGWAGEGLCGFSGVNSYNVGKLEANPSPQITCSSSYHGGNSSTFGHPNAWNGGANMQDFSLLRTPGNILELVARDTFVGGPDEVSSLPATLNSFAAGQAYYLELWAQTMHPTGFATVSADITFDPAAFQVDTAYSTWPFTGGVYHGSLFNASPWGVVNNGTGLIDDLSGLYLPGTGCTNDSTGVEPGWSRVAVIRMLAQSSGALSILVDQTHSGIYTIGVCGAPVDPALVDFRGINEPAGSLRLDVPNPPQTVMQGGTVTVNLSLAGLNQATNGIQALFHYNPVNLHLVSITPAPTWNAIPAYFQDINGDVAYANVIPGGSIGPGAGPFTAATLTFTALDDGTPRVSFLPDNPASFPTLANQLTEAAHGAALSPSANIDTVDGHIVILPCNDNNLCTTDTFDDVTHQCVYTPVPVDDGIACTVDTCNPLTGEITHTPNNAACDDGLFCTDDVCDPASGCQHPAHSCDDSVACTVDTCNEATDACDHTPNNAACDDGNPCTDDTCNSTTGCVNTNNTAPCDDGLWCTENDVCANGACHGTARDCSDGLSCTTDTCSETNQCEHALIAGNCKIDNACWADGALNPANPCQVCNVALSTTAWSNATDGTSCSDGLYCNGAETCQNGACAPGTAPCVDQAHCDEANDHCFGCVSDVECDDHLWCNGQETCNQTTHICQPGTPPNCSDNIDCTVDTCNETTDSCDHVANNALCDDGNACTDDTCNPTTGCVHTNNTAPCDDGLWCTVNDVCANGACHGTDRDCSDAFACTKDTCNEALHRCDNTLEAGYCMITDECWADGTPNPSNSCQVCNSALNPTGWSNVVNGTSCSDGTFCNGAETCQNGACTLGTPPCDQAHCDEVNDMCLGCVSDAECNDGQWCNGQETCNQTTHQCQAGTPPDCDDHIACTADSCNEATDSCVHTDTTSIVVNVSIQGLSHAVTRNVTFVLTDCGVGTDTRTVPVAFNASGVGTATLTNVSTTLDWIQAREGHTLNTVLPLDFAGGCTATANFTGDDQLIAGDFSNWGWVAQDGLVDIQDFAILAVYWNQPVDAALGTQADATGDGIQDGGDFTAIQANFARVSDPAPVCARSWPGSISAIPDKAVVIDGFAVEIPVAALAMPNAALADRNGDGVIGLADIRIFALENNIDLEPVFEARLGRLEWLVARQQYGWSPPAD